VVNSATNHVNRRKQALPKQHIAGGGPIASAVHHGKVAVASTGRTQSLPRRSISSTAIASRGATLTSTSSATANVIGSAAPTTVGMNNSTNNSNSMYRGELSSAELRVGYGMGMAMPVAATSTSRRALSINVSFN
jgi:hypothetical protein